jgi:small subunit ribosomal protein S17
MVTTQIQPTIATKKPQTFVGTVVSDKMKDTIVVTVDRYIKHAKYQKFMNRRAKFMVHDPGNTKKIGEKVTIVACRPLSKRKAFKLSS